MEASFTRKQTITPGICDASGRLGCADTFRLFQDVASEHAERMGLGGIAMQKQHAFWMTVRTRVHFYKRPRMMQEVDLSTWPMAPGRMRCDRCYRLSDDETLLAEGRTEWCVYDTQANAVRSTEGLFDPETVFSDALLLPVPYARFRHDFAEDDRACTHVVRASDVDVGRHMNNVAYLRMLMDSFSVAEQERMRITEMEILFCMPCFEGEALDVLRRRTDSGYEFGVRRPDGRYAALALLRAEV